MGKENKKSKRLQKYKEFLKNVKWVLIAIAAIGIILIIFSMTVLKVIWINKPWPEFPDFISTLGASLLIGSIVGGIIEITEIAGYFEKRIANFFVKHEYINLLRDEELDEITLKAFEKRVQCDVNNPDHVWHECYTSFNKNILPKFYNQCRRNFTKSINITHLSVKELKEELNEKSLNETENYEILRYVSSTEYDLISPRDDKETEYTIKFCGYGIAIPNLTKDKHVKEVKLIIDNEDVTRKAKKDIKKNGTSIENTTSYNLKYLKKRHVKFEETTYELGKENCIASRMNLLTQGLYIIVNIDRKVFFNAKLFTFNPELYEPQIHRRSVFIQYRGYLLPTQGFVITWV